MNSCPLCTAQFWRVLQTGLLLLSVIGSAVAEAGAPEFTIRIRDHLFHPQKTVVPAGTKVKLIVVNEDPTPEEFESYELNREKVIMGGRKAIIFIGPLHPGSYPYFGEFNPKTAQGMVEAR